MSTPLLPNPAKRHRVAQLVCSLQFKATILVVALTLCVTGVVSGYLLQSSIKLSREEHCEQLKKATDMLARMIGSKAMASPIAEFGGAERDEIGYVIRDLVGEGMFAYVRVVDLAGRPLAEAGWHGSGGARTSAVVNESERPLGVPTLVTNESGVASHLDLFYPITSSSRVAADEPPGKAKLIGYVRTGLAVNRWYETMARTLDLIIGVGLVAAAMAILLGFLLIRRIVSPLENLAQKMLRFSRGELNVRSEINRKDEIGELSSAFDRMADEHQRAVDRLVRLNAELEDRVVERTRQLEELASRDPLTGIFNRRYFNEMLTHHFAQAQRYGHDLACLMLDLDEFKLVNDKHGHLAGDELLTLVSGTVLAELRDADICARYGGDEFVVLLPRTDIRQASLLAQRILDVVSRAIRERMSDVLSTMSVGVSSLRASNAENAEEILRAADRSMYDAKNAGKGRIVTSVAERATAS